MKESRAKERNGKQKNTENKRTQEQTATLTKKKKKLDKKYEGKRQQC